MGNVLNREKQERKGGSSARAGQALRGSSEFHAWGDSNLYLRRRGEALELSLEHRAARSIADLRLELSPEEPALALRVVDAEHDDSRPLDVHQRVVGALRDAGAPLRVQQLRRACRMRTQTLILALRQLADRGTVERSNEGYRLASCTQATVSFPLSLRGPRETETGNAGA